MSKCLMLKPPRTTDDNLDKREGKRYTVTINLIDDSDDVDMEEPLKVTVHTTTNHTYNDGKSEVMNVDGQSAELIPTHVSVNKDNLPIPRKIGLPFVRTVPETQVTILEKNIIPEKGRSSTSFVTN